MYRETHSATLYSKQPYSTTEGLHHRDLYFDLGQDGVLHVSTRYGVQFDPAQARFAADLRESYADLVIPFNIDIGACADLGSVDVDLYVGTEQSRRQSHCPDEWLFLESHQLNERLVGSHWYAHRPSETVYLSVTVPSGDEDPLLVDTLTPPADDNEWCGLQNVETGAMGRAPREHLSQLAESGALTTVLPVRS